MAIGRTWTKEDKEYLDEHWGRCTLSYISTHLKRTKVAVKLKAKRMHLGAITRADEYMTANQVSVLLNIDRHAITRWILKHGLKANKKVMLFKKRLWMIKYSDLCEWLSNNQDKFDSERIEIFALGYEPLWLKEKRKRDMKLPKNRFKKWTSLEVQRIIIYAKEMTYYKIALLMGRSYDSIERKMGRLKPLIEK